MHNPLGARHCGESTPKQSTEGTERAKERNSRYANTPSDARPCRPHAGRELLQHWAPGWKQRRTLDQATSPPRATTWPMTRVRTTSPWHRLYVGTAEGGDRRGSNEQKSTRTKRQRGQRTKSRREGRTTTHYFHAFDTYLFTSHILVYFTYTCLPHIYLPTLAYLLHILAYLLYTCIILL